MKNRRLAEAALEFLARRGVTDICVCAGRRDAPLVVLLERQRGFTVHSFFEERSAAFFALGCAKRSGRPAAIVTTSGTAAAELLPAFIEAHYSGSALIGITADRPRRLRGTGAPQTIDQVGLFGPYVAACLDVEAGEPFPLIAASAAASLHLNLCFDEPLVEGPAPELAFSLLEPADPSAAGAGAGAALERFLVQVKKPLVVVGPVKAQARAAVKEFIRSLGAPAYLEAPSGLRGAPDLAALELCGGNGAAAQGLKNGVFDGVVRIGGVPAARLWRDLDETAPAVPVLHITAAPFPGLSRGELVLAPLHKLEPFASPIDPTWLSDTLDADRMAAQKLIECIESEPSSEAALVRTLSRAVPHDAAVYLGNSLPIREWDLGAVREKTWSAVEANRGANGIDGQLSTFFGWSLDAAERWCVLGDLTALYDLSAPACAPEGGKTRIVIVNNGGGQIFRRMFGEKLFRNEHAISFAGWASMWGFDYLRVERFPLPENLSDRVVIELRPDQAASDRMWERYDALGRRG